MERAFKKRLDTGSIRLALPAMKVGSVIGQDQSNISHKGGNFMLLQIR